MKGGYQSLQDKPPQNLLLILIQIIHVHSLNKYEGFNENLVS